MIVGQVINKHARQAFALIIVLIISSSLMIFTLACWHRFMLCQDLVMLREQYQEHFYLTETALNKGVLLVQQNPEWLTNKQIRDGMPLEFDVTTQVLSQITSGMTIKQFTAAIIISTQNMHAGARAKKRTKNIGEDFLIVSAQLRESDKVIMVLRCTVTKDKREYNGIQDTQIKKFPIIIDNFTIGSSL